MKVKTEKFNYKGQVSAHGEDRNYYLWNALPDEEVEVSIIKKKSGIYHGVATKIIKASKHRIEPLEDSFLSTSPWQIMDWKMEMKSKVEITTELFKNYDIKLPEFDIESNDIQQGYRNKMEFSFVENEDGSKSLAFFKREGKGKIGVTGSLLAEEIINQSAQHILAWINKEQIPIRSLKTLIVRSNGKGQAIAGFFIKDELDFKSLPTLIENLLGIQIFYSTHKSPASVPTKLMHVLGNNTLEAEINRTKLQFGLFSFFQINIPVFEKALDDIGKFITEGSEVVDFYSGVGSISLCLKDKIKKAYLIESNPEAVDFAKHNIELNKVKNFEVNLIESEKALEFIQKGKIIIFDPPRTGLHKKVLEKINDVKPEIIIYLSCGPETQAHDLNEIQKHYRIEFMQLYNFFPRTPHTESLIVLKKIS